MILQALKKLIAHYEKQSGSEAREKLQKLNFIYFNTP